MKKKVLLIHTGGTIGMIRDHESGIFKPDLFYASLMKVIPELQDLAEIKVVIPFLVDSAEINGTYWKKIAHIIKEEIENLHGVVITHGTDTLAYTASALSYMLMNIQIPVILTGAQKPLSELRTDARTNLINAVEIATSDEIKEVAIFFDNKLMRGNRTIKNHINHFDAFSSPNYPLLAQVGIDIDIYSRNLLKPGGLFHVFDNLDNAIALYKIFPGCRNDYFRPEDDIRAIIMITYGAGNIPIQSNDLLHRAERWLNQGKIVVVMSETRAGKVDPKLYEAGNRLMKIGVLDTGDMTFEASVTKLMFLLGQYQEPAIIKKNFQKSLAGEKTG